LYDDWKKRRGEVAADMPEFQAGKGLFERFKSRDSLHNIKLTGESFGANKEAAQEFVKTFSRIIEEGDYSARRIFNAEERGLFLYKMPA